MSRVALITGGSRGLGAHLVSRFWLEGYSLLVLARRCDEVQVVLDALPTRVGQFATSLSCDLADTFEVSSLLSEIKSKFSHLDVLVNNAAIQGPIGPLSTNEFSEWQKTLQVNLFAQVALCQGLIPLMRKPGASIINLSGGGGDRASCKL